MVDTLTKISSVMPFSGIEICPPEKTVFSWHRRSMADLSRTCSQLTTDQFRRVAAKCKGG